MHILNGVALALQIFLLLSSQDYKVPVFGLVMTISFSPICPIALFGVTFYPITCLRWRWRRRRRETWRPARLLHVTTKAETSKTPVGVVEDSSSLLLVLEVCGGGGAGLSGELWKPSELGGSRPPPPSSSSSTDLPADELPETKRSSIWSTHS